jgi:hypothetical protein
VTFVSAISSQKQAMLVLLSSAIISFQGSKEHSLGYEQRAFLV